MAWKYEQLQSMSREDLIREHDQMAPNVSVGLQWVLDELHRRDAKDSADRMEAATQEVRMLTRVIAALTVVTTVAAVVTAIAA